MWFLSLFFEENSYYAIESNWWNETKKSHHHYGSPKKSIPKSMMMNINEKNCWIFHWKKTIKWRLLSVLFGRNENVQFLWTCMLHGCIHWFIRIIHNWSLSLLSLANDVHHKQKTKNFLFYCTLSIFSICFLEKIFASEKKRKSKINIIIISIDFCINSSGCCCCFLPSFFPWRIQQQQQKIRNECETREFFPSLLFPYLKK